MMARQGNILLKNVATATTSWKLGQVSGKLRDRCHPDLFSNIARRTLQKLLVQPLDSRTEMNYGKQTKESSASSYDIRTSHAEITRKTRSTLTLAFRFNRFS
jgi:hypothetical protein